MTRRGLLIQALLALWLTGGCESSTNLISIKPDRGAGGGSGTVREPLRQGTECHNNGWCTDALLLQGNHLYAIWGSGPSDVFAVGDLGTILHFDGKKWSGMSSGTDVPLYGVWGSGPTHVLAVGGTSKTRLVLRYDGLSWTTALAAERGGPLRSVWGNGASDVFAVAPAGVVLRHDGQGWSESAPARGQQINTLWGFDRKHLYAVGDQGLVLRHDGVSWRKLKAVAGHDLFAVWGSDPNNVFMAGDGVLVRHHEETLRIINERSQGDDPHPFRALGAWGSGPLDVYFVGGEANTAAMIWRHHGNTTERTPAFNHWVPTLRAVWGSSKDDVFVVGDMGVILRRRPYTIK